jgi:hypothetical protein
MKESLQRFDRLAGNQLSGFIGILFSCFIGILFVGAPFELVASKVVSLQLILLSEFISWLLLFGGGALLAALLLGTSVNKGCSSAHSLFKVIGTCAAGSLG